MKPENKAKIAFLFGAGAEFGDENFNIPGGYDFLLNTLLKSTDVDEDTIGLAGFFTEKYFCKLPSEEKIVNYSQYKIGDKVYRNSVLKSAVKVASESGSFIEENHHFIKEILSKGDWDQMLENSKIEESKLVGENKISEITGESIFAEWNEVINKITLKQKYTTKDKKGEKIFEFFKKFIKLNEDCIPEFVDGIPISNRLDSKFHSLIDPCTFGQIPFFKVFNYYWFCYFYIVRYILLYIDKHYSGKDNELKEYYSIDEKQYEIIHLNYQKILNNICDFTIKMESAITMREDKQSYYYFTRKQFGDRVRGIITTNYSTYCEKVFDTANIANGEKDDSEKIAYINGKLSLFEFPEFLETKKANKDNNEIFKNDKLWFPFIFGQSYIKPIINRKQIDEFTKMNSILDEINILVVLGYGINRDDNHLNAFLHDFLCIKDHYIVYVTDSEKENVYEKLRSPKFNNIIYCKVNYEKYSNEEVVNKIFKKIKNIDI